MMKPRRGCFALLSAALLTALLTMPAGAATNPMNLVNPPIPKVKKVCLDSGEVQYQFESVAPRDSIPGMPGSHREYQSISSSEGTRDGFQYESDPWRRDGSSYYNQYDTDKSDAARIANFSTVCRRAATALDSATQAAADSSATWQQVVDATSYSAQAAAWNRWNRDHCVSGGRIDCGATYPTFAQTCAQNPPGTKLSTGETCPN